VERREFLKNLFRYGLLTYSAFQYGCDISRMINKPHSRIAIAYGTKYGSTKETAFWIAEGIQADVDVINVEEANFNKGIENHDAYVLGSGIWIDGIHQDLRRFLVSKKTIIDGKVLATFVVCGSRDNTESGRMRIKGYLEQINNYLKTPPPYSCYFGGRLIIENLTPEDYEILEEFYRTYLNKEMESWNYMDREKTVEFGKKLIVDNNRISKAITASVSVY
jgi:menaquinone-dependent protoporphyrinogen IX oxidase